MPKGVKSPSMDVAEDLRQIINARRQGRARLRIGALVGGIAIPLAASILWRPPTLLVWNASSSAPTGLYRVLAEKGVSRGDLVIAWTPSEIRPLAAQRRYLPINVPLVKRVAAGQGDRVCAVDAAILINGRQVAQRQRYDAARRPMPWWRGCHSLGAHEYLLLMNHARSFDGRYFGATKASDIVGRAVLLWAR